MSPKGFPFVAAEGMWLVLLTAAAAVAVYLYCGPYAALPLGLLAVLCVTKFRDPERSVPAVSLGIVSPVDGRVREIAEAYDECLERAAIRIHIRVSFFGAYSVRGPVEGKVMEFRNGHNKGNGRSKGLWLRTDEGDDVLMVMRGPRWLRPIALVRYGERLGQGQRCGYLRLAHEVLLYVPAGSRVEVASGTRVRAGSSLVAQFVRGRQDA